MRLKRSSKKKGVSLIEVLVVLGILGVIAGLSYPTFAAGQFEAKKAANMVRLRQIGLALQLYMADHQEDISGPTKGMPFAEVYLMETAKAKGGFYGVGREHQRSSCGKHPKALALHGGLLLPTTEEPERFQEAFYFFEEDPPIVLDENCNPHSLNIQSIYTLKMGMCVTYSGRVFKKQSRQSVATLEFWK